MRDHVGDAEDRFFATVFLGSGLLFVAMLFAGTAMASGLAAGLDASTSPATDAAWQMSLRTTSVVVTAYAMRMAAVFTISTTSIGSRVGAIPRWLTIYGYATAPVLLLTVSTLPWAELLFPIWVLVLSVHLLRAKFRSVLPDGDS